LAYRLASEAAACVAFSPGLRTVGSLTGKSALACLPSGVYFPKVMNLLPAGSVLSAEAFSQDLKTLQAKGYGPVKLAVDPRGLPEGAETACLPFMADVTGLLATLKAQPGVLLAEGLPSEGFALPETEEIYCVLDAACTGDAGLSGFLRKHGVTRLCLTRVCGEPDACLSAAQTSLGLPVPFYTAVGRPYDLRENPS